MEWQGVPIGAVPRAATVRFRPIADISSGSALASRPPWRTGREGAAASHVAVRHRTDEDTRRAVLWFEHRCSIRVEPARIFRDPLGWTRPEHERAEPGIWAIVP